jgi:hypothetical protein
MSYGGHGDKIHDLHVAKKLCTGIYGTYNMDLCCSTRTVPHTAFGFHSAYQIHIEIHMESKQGYGDFLAIL